MSARQVLSAPDIERTLRRIGHEIVEATPEVSSLVLLGIPTRGALLSQRLAEVIADMIQDGRKEIAGVQVTCFPTNHPGGCYGYRFDKDNVSVAYVTDNELPIQPGDTFPDLENKGGLRKMPEDMLEKIKGVDLLVADSQYDETQYAEKVGWGHSSCFSTTYLGIQAGAKALALFHHDPESTDEEIDEKVAACRRRVEHFGSEMTVFAAREGVELKF